MKYKVHLDLMVEFESEVEKTNEEIESLAKMHVKNALIYNPDADDCTITDVDVSVKY